MAVEPGSCRWSLGRTTTAALTIGRGEEPSEAVLQRRRCDRRGLGLRLRLRLLRLLQRVQVGVRVGVRRARPRRGQVAGDGARHEGARLVEVAWGHAGATLRGLFEGGRRGSGGAAGGLLVGARQGENRWTVRWHLLAENELGFVGELQPGSNGQAARVGWGAGQVTTPVVVPRAQAAVGHGSSKFTDAHTAVGRLSKEECCRVGALGHVHLWLAYAQ